MKRIESERYCYGSGLLTVCLVLIAAASLAGEPEQLDPAWQWESGQSRQYRLRLERHQTVFAEKRFESKLVVEAVIRMEGGTAAAKDAKGMPVDMEFERLRLELHAGTRHFRFDSGSESAPNNPISLWEQVGEALLNAKFRLSQTRTGRITVLNGFDDELAGILHSRGGSEKRAAFQIERLFGSEHMERILNSCMHILPKGPIEDNRHWVKRDNVELEMGLVVDRQEKYKVSDGDEPAAMRIEMTGSMNLAGGDSENIKLPAGTAEIGVTASSLEGETRFSSAKGCVERQERRGTLELEMTISTAGSRSQSTTATVHLRQNTEFDLLPMEGE